MEYYPICIDIKGKKCIVVGGGKVALRKAKRLSECGAEVWLISPQLGKGEVEPIKWLKKEYESGDLKGAFLVIAATGQEAVNKQVSDEAGAANILVNVVDSPQNSTFILPAVLNRGNLSIAISTAGKSPGLAKKIRQSLEQEFGPEYAEFVEMLGLLRPVIMAKYKDASTRQAIWQCIVNSEIPQLLANGEKEKVLRVVNRCLPEPE